MVDMEIQRLRRLRGSALRVRAVAIALRRRFPGRDDDVLRAGQYAAWRVARAVAGRLRAHPYRAYQKDAGVGVVLKNAYVASLGAFGVTSRHLAHSRFHRHLTDLARLLEDARALTSAAELHEAFGHSHLELRSLFRALEDPSSARGPNPQSGAAAPGEPAPDAHWPYLAF